MTRILHRQLQHPVPIAVSAAGAYLFDAAGKGYLDASGGAAVSCIGHGNAEVIAAISAQASEMAYAHSSFFSSRPAEELADYLVERAPAGLSHAYFVSGGSEGVEAALKMARQYFVEIGQASRRHVIARRQSYHGNTLGALATGGNQSRRAPFAPLLVETHHIDPCYAYRFMSADETAGEYAARTAQALEDKILELGAESVMAFVAEPVVGATAGAVPPVADYFRRIRDICDRHGVLLILDEVMCGMGRTGPLYACERDGIAPDLLVIAKGLGAGYQPIGAVLLAQRIHDAFHAGSGSFQHGHTYNSHPIACAAALAVQKIIQREGLLANVERMGAYLRRRLGERFGNHPHVGDIRGRGLLLGLEMVQDRLTKAPFDPSMALHTRLKRAAMAHGLLIYPSGGCIDGVRGDHILLAPQFSIDEETVGVLVDRLADAIDEAVASRGNG